jgi:glycerophosphoryl diester phosphodiesterase
VQGRPSALEGARAPRRRARGTCAERSPPTRTARAVLRPAWVAAALALLAAGCAAPSPAARAFREVEITLGGSGRVPLVIAHQGGKLAGAPPNSLASLDAGARAGVHFVEVDVRLSRDGAPFLLHDDTLARAAGIDARLADLDAAAIAGARLANGEPVPTLAQALARARGRVHLELHVKEDAALGPAIAAARAAGAEREAVFLLTDDALREDFRASGAGLRAIFRAFPRDDIAAMTEQFGLPAALQVDADAPRSLLAAARAARRPLLGKVGFAGGGPAAAPADLERALREGFLIFETDEPERVLAELRDLVPALGASALAAPDARGNE